MTFELALVSLGTRLHVIVLMVHCVPPVPAVPDQQSADVSELSDGEISRQRSLLAFLQYRQTERQREGEMVERGGERERWRDGGRER